MCAGRGDENECVRGAGDEFKRDAAVVGERQGRGNMTRVLGEDVRSAGRKAGLAGRVGRVGAAAVYELGAYG